MNDIKDAIVADSRYKKYRDRFYDMTEKEAALIRKLAVDEGKSWEQVAVGFNFTGEFGHIPPNDEKIAGMMLCEKAAEIHGELYLASPWYELKEALSSE